MIAVRNEVECFYIPFFVICYCKTCDDDSTKIQKVKVKTKTNLKRKWNPEENIDDFNDSAEMEEV